MSATLLFVLVSWISIIPSSTRAQDGGRELYFPAYYFYAQKHFVNHLIKTMIVKDLDECEYRCYLDANCVSLNIKNKYPNGTHECELNNATHLDDERDLKHNPLYYYRGADPKCGKNRRECENNSTCQSGFTPKGYRCLCTAGFEGEHCEKDINECHRGSHNCHGNATCNNTKGGFNCSCKEGYTGDGQNCTDIDECVSSNPCLNGGTCINGMNKFTCICKRKFTGTRCETEYHCHEYKTFDASNRNLANAEISRNLLDCTNNFQEEWYRFTGDAGTRLPTQCPQIPSQKHSVWLNVEQEKLPHKGRVKDGICVCLSQSSPSCCKVTPQNCDFKITVQNCSSYLVYKLHKIPSCPYNYYGTN